MRHVSSMHVARRKETRPLFMHHVKCANCGLDLQVPEGHAAQMLRCPGCGQAFAVMGGTAARPAAPVDPALNQFLVTTGQRGGRRTDPRATQTVPTILQVYGVVIMVLQALLAFVNLLYYFTLAAAAVFARQDLLVAILVLLGIVTLALHYGLYDMGGKLRHGRRLAVIVLGIVSVLAVAGALVTMVVGVVLMNEVGLSLLGLGMFALVFSGAVYVAPTIAGIYHWNRLW